jgi:iron complex transport system ATP-binding protein
MLLRIDNLSFAYPGTPVLEDIGFSVEPGDFVSVVGPNGSGKTTLLKLLDRILVPQQGTIRFRERLLHDITRAELARRISYVPQETGWVFPFTVLDIVLMGRSPHLGRRVFEGADDIRIAHQAMELVDVARLAEHPITGISGGERQRVLIARALAQKPEMVLLDEPNAHLDLLHQLEIFAVLRDRNREEGLTVISVSHDLNLAAAFSSHVLLLGQMRDSGEAERAPCHVLAFGSPREVLTPPLLHESFGARVLVDRHPTVGSPRVTPDPTMIIRRKGL